MDCAALAQFLAELEHNNNKTWFEANRSRYDALRADFTDLVEEVIFGVAAFDPRAQGLTPKDCIYRIYRDVRFSKDKTPYKTTFSAAIPRNMIGAGYYFQLAHDGKLMTAGGYYMPDNDALARIRTFIAQRPGQLQAVLDEPGFRAQFGTLDGPRLTRLPRGFDEDTPLPDMVKLKSFTVAKEYPVRDLDGDALAPLVVADFRAMRPLVAWLREALGYMGASVNRPA